MKTRPLNTRLRLALLDDWSGVLKDGWRSPQVLLLLFAASIPIAFETWSVLINNFVVEKAAFTGKEIGVLQGLREVPGFLAFTVVFMLLVWRQQTFAVLSLAVMGVGVAMAGFLPTLWGLYFTTVLMSTGFHYLATMEQSLAMQWTSERELPVVLGRMTAVASFASLATYGLVFGALTWLELSYLEVFLIGGGLTLGIAALARFGFPHFPTSVHQTTAIVLRRRYWLYYALEFLSGARRQIFIVFAAFMMVETFGYTAANITLLFLVNCLISIWVAPRVGRLIVRWASARRSCASTSASSASSPPMPSSRRRGWRRVSMSWITCSLRSPSRSRATSGRSRTLRTSPRRRGCRSPSITSPRSVCRRSSAWSGCWATRAAPPSF